MPSARRAVNGHARLLLIITLSVAVLVGAACGGSSEAQPPSNLPPPPARENVSFLYQRLRSAAEVSKLGRAKVVVLGQQNGARAARLVHSTGAKAYRYVQTYWSPAGSTYDGLDIGKERSWTFCSRGSKTLVGRVDALGREWWFLDMNERSVHTYFAQKLAKLKAEGWDGVFFDRGFASLTGFDTEQAGIWNTVSTCTTDPVTRGATLADAYVGMTGEVANAGLELMFNYGVSPFDPQTPLRPDPKNPACGQRDFAACPRIDDAWEHATWILDEGVAHPQDQQWDDDFAANRANEQDPDHGGKTVGLITQNTLAGDTSKAAAYFEWARAKLFAIPTRGEHGRHRLCRDLGSLQPRGALPAARRHGIREAAKPEPAVDFVRAGVEDPLRLEPPVRLRDVRGERLAAEGPRAEAGAGRERMPLRERRLVRSAHRRQQVRRCGHAGSAGVEWASARLRGEALVATSAFTGHRSLRRETAFSRP